MTQGSLAERLRVLRAQHGLSLTEASEKIGVNRHTLRDLELGKREPYGPTIRKIAEGYSVPVARLLEEPVPLAKAPRGAGRAEIGAGLEEWLEEPYVESWARYLEGQCDFFNVMLEDTEGLSDDSISWIAAQTIDLCAIYAHDRVEERREYRGETAKRLDRAVGELGKLYDRAIRMAAQRQFQASAREDFSAGKHVELDDTARAIFGRETG
jgi:transcriptional regulator with XRE-family HTH domain